MRKLLLATALVALFGASVHGDEVLDARADQFLADYTTAAEEQYFESVTVSWMYNTNLTDENAAAVEAQAVKDAEFTLEWGTKAKNDFSDTDMGNLNEYRSRQIESIQVLGTANLAPAKQTQYNSISTSMDRTYSTACAQLSDGSCHPLEPDLTQIMRSSRDYYELKEAWKGWYEAAGRPIKDDYATFASLSNEAYVGDGYADTGEYWRSWYETDNFEAVLENLWQELRPMYNELHAYVRRKLYENYGPDFINLHGPIPAHLLGNMWAQTWGNIYDLVEPYKGKSSVDATPKMLDLGWNATKMFEVSEEFFTSLGLYEMTDKFWERSMIVKPPDRDVVCHASAWDFYHTDKDDFRIKQCTVVNMGDLITVHHEMGHIQYFQQYKEQPVPYRGGANPGFHEAVGDTLSLSVSTPAHLQAIGLLDDVDDDDEADINYLMSQALDKIAFLPFGYMIDKWRWSVFDGSTPKAQYQSKWDELRLQYQGIVPPVMRDDVLDFDPGAKYHIPGNTPYIRYFVSFVVQFQFYEAMCNEKGHTGPLYKCDFYESTEAGKKLGDMLKLGSSQKWPVAMEALTGSPDMTTASLQRYFEPLTEWLKEQNQVNGDEPGWAEEDWRPKGFQPADGAAPFVEAQNTAGEVAYFQAVETEWNYNTDTTQANQDASVAASQDLANFIAEQGVNAKLYDPKEIEGDDPTTARLITKMSDLGTGALPEEELAEYTQSVADMSDHYSRSTVCGLGGGDACVPLDPDLTETMATSRNYNDLRDAWKGWRDVITDDGNTRSKFETYVTLGNKAATLNNYDDMGAYWRSAYETPDFDEQLERVWREVLPLYEELHAYVRRKLYFYYGPDVINPKGPLPAHLLGNMWAQDWVNIYDLVEPFPGKTRPDATPALKSWTIDEMFRTADKFFSDLGLEACPQEFWEESMFIKPPAPKGVICHASAWDFYNKKDFRVKMCTVNTQSDFITIHHELGHIQYYLQYKNQHVAFRDGANPGFHEAVGDTLALSVSTLDHMHKLGLIDEPSDDTQSNINYLMSQALDKIAFLPFGYLIDKWRWDVFSGEADSKNMNQAWWEYRIKYQGVTPPVPRTEADFDPAAKFHVSNNVPYIRYFTSFIIQFQFYEAMCKEANHTGPLYKCDFDGNKAAGEKLGNMLKLGSSVRWEEALRQVTGSSQMSSASLLNYFKDLSDFLKIENAKFDEVMGWPDYSWEPPQNTIVEEDNRVVLDDGNGAGIVTSSTMLVTSFACFILALSKTLTE